MTLATLVLIGGGCSEKITNTRQGTRVNVVLSLKGGPAVSYRLTISAVDMENIEVPITPTDAGLTATITVPAGTDREFLVEASDPAGTVLYRGVVVSDVVSVLPLELTIPMEPTVPLLYMNPHFARVHLGSDFTITVHAHDLPGTSGAGVGLSLTGIDPYVLAEIAYIDTVVLAPEQVARGSWLTYQTYGGGEIYFDIGSNFPIVDAAGDGALVVVHCRTLDTWLGEPVDLIPEMYIETLGGYGSPLDSVSIDNARYHLFRDELP
ncbi:MAG: hypothetical protein ABIF77_19075 [bacterium]